MNTPNKNPVPTDPRSTPFMTAYGTKPRVQLECNDPSRAKQSFQKECDINTIMGQYQKTGLVTHVARYGGNYEELPSNMDYHESLNAIIAAQESFDSLPSSLRNKFNNNPGEFLSFVEKEENRDELIEMGLAKQQPEGANQNQKEAAADQDEVAPVDDTSKGAKAPAAK